MHMVAFAQHRELIASQGGAVAILAWNGNAAVYQVDEGSVVRRQRFIKARALVQTDV